MLMMFLKQNIRKLKQILNYKVMQNAEGTKQNKWRKSYVYMKPVILNHILVDYLFNDVL
jgi:hypothetical protein